MPLRLRPSVLDDAEALASVVRGAGQFCSLGHWVAREATGRWQDHELWQVLAPSEGQR